MKLPPMPEPEKPSWANFHVHFPKGCEDINLLNRMAPFPHHGSEGTIQFIGYRFFARPAMLCTSEKRLAARRAVIAAAFRPRPFHAPFLITLFSNKSSPQRNSSFHYSYAGGKAEIVYHSAWPFLTLMTGVVSL